MQEKPDCNIKNVYFYSRWSSDAQSDGDSGRRQEDMALRWCQQRGVNITAEETDDVVSAWKGKNRRDGTGLSRLINRLQPGDYVLVEDADRLSRQDWLRGANLIAEITGKANLYTDKISGSKAARPGLDACLQQLKAGDTLLVWRLDRLGRSLRHLIDLVEELRQRGVGFKSICDGAIDTTTASGELIFNVFASLAQFERRLIQERTKAGLTAARARGRLGGRKPVSISDPRVQTAKKMHADKSLSVADICKTLRISRPTLYRYLAMK
jgi:DNA invertase Pin-like site-specific DNA recombinase